MIDITSTRSRRFRFEALLLMFACLIAGCTESPTSPMSSQSGTLYYESTGRGIYKYDFASGTQTGLFNGHTPSLFPSGEMVVTGQYDESLEIVTASGTSRTTILSGEIHSIFEPKVSPDGSRIAFTFYDNNKTRTVHTIVVDKAGNTIVSFENLMSPSWTPDGRLVMAGSWHVSAVTSSITSYGSPGIYITDASLTQASPIPVTLTDPMHPAVSRDGSRVAFISNADVWTMNIDGSNLKQITTGEKQERYPSWSPDGASIACLSYGTFETTFYEAIAIVPSNPAAPTNMTNDAGIWPRDKNTPNQGAGRLNGVSYITWK